MNDLETRAEQAFRDALSRQADAFEPASLAPISQRSRVRRWVGIVAAASVLLLLGSTALGVAVWRDDAGEAGRDTVSEPAAGWRYESYRDVQIEVPESWGYAAAPGSDWCAGVPGGEGRFPRQPHVDTNGRFDMVLSIGCVGRSDLLGGQVPERLWESHVSLVDAGGPNAVEDGTVTVEGWTRIARTIGATQVRVLADAGHVEQARRIAESAEVVAADHNGCSATSEIQAMAYVRPTDAFDVAEVADVDSISVCQYAMGEGTERPWLLASRQLTGTEADDVLAAIKAAPVGGGPNTPKSCLHEVNQEPAIVLRLNAGHGSHEVYVYNASCINNGFDDGTTVRELTRAACVPLYEGRVTYSLGSSAPAGRCVASETALPKP